MADSTEEDTDIQYLGLLVPALIALIAGLVIHSFIIGVNVTDWWKGRSVIPVDLIVTSLGISRMCGQCANTLLIFKHSLFLSSLGSLTTLIIGFIRDLFNHANFWLTSLLSIVLCLKISNFHTGLFLYLRGVIVHRTVYFIVATVFFSALNSMIPLLVVNKTMNSGTYNTTTNCTDVDSIHTVHLGAFIPVIFYYISSVVLFSSLYHHTRKMKMSSNLSINLETYYSVMRFISFTFIYSNIFFICCFLAVYYYFFHCLSLYWPIIILDFLPVLHSCYLIYRTPKLRSQMSKGLQNVTDVLFKRKSTKT